MRTASAKPVAVEFTCPHCRDTIPAPNGSLFWTVNEITQTLKCPHCGALSLPPKQYR